MLVLALVANSRAQLPGLKYLNLRLSGSGVTLPAWLGIIFLLAAAFSVHHFWTDQSMDRMGQQVHFNKNLALAAALLLVTFVPAGTWVIALNP